MDRLHASIRSAVRGDQERKSLASYILAAAAVVLLTAAMFGFREELGVLNITLLYLLLSFGLGLVIGTRPAAFGAVLAFFAFDFLFIPPYNTLSVSDEDHILGLFVYLAVAVIAAILVGRIRRATDEAIRESRRTSLLYDLNRSLVGDVALGPLLQTIVRSVVEVYESRSCRILVADPDNGDLHVEAAWPEDAGRRVERDAMAMAQHTFTSRKAAGLRGEGRTIRQPHGTRTAAIRRESGSRADVLYVPIVASTRALGVLEVGGRPNGGGFNAEDERLLASFADQVALAMERTRLIAESTRVAALEQSSALKSSLLAAVSHDLRTPLAAIKASSSALLDASITWTDADRRELLSAIDEESDRLTLMVSNLLDLSRIEGGALLPDRDWQDMSDLLTDVERRMRSQTAHHRLNIKVDDLPLVFLDYVEISQVLINLIGNAAKYSPTGSSIIVTAQRNHAMLRVAVTDSGPGIPPSRLPHIFETFYRAHDEGTVSGSGIGLAICKGLVEAHGGRIWAHSALGVGTTVTFEIPLEADGAP